MKRVLSIVAVGAFIFTMASCSKDHTCECKDSNGDVVSTSTINSTKAAAKTSCEAVSYSGTTCSLQ